MLISDWNLLKTLYETRNITRTAENLYLTQPTVTKRLRVIENEFDVHIADRGKKGLTFTPEGEYLAAKASQFQGMEEEIRAYLSKQKSLPSGSITIGASSSFTRFYLPSIIEDFRRYNPNIQFDIVTSLSNEVGRMVEQRKVDIGFVNGDFPFSGDKELILAEHGYIASNTAPDMDHLYNAPYLSYFNDKNTQSIIENWWKEHYTVPLPKGLAVKDGDICKSMVIRGLGYSIFFSHGYMEDFPENIYPLYHKDRSPLLRNLWILYSSGSKEKNTTIEFLKSVKRIVATP